MNTIYKLLTLWVATLTLLTGCVEPFELPESAPDESLLVVDGHVNLELGQAMVRLTRTQNLNEEGTPPAETGAQVSVENEQGESTGLIAQPYDDGLYMFTGIRLEYGEKYRLRIKTRSGREYLSEFVSSQKTPAIDSLTWNVEREGVQVRLNTHDPRNSTRYYRWEYEETYEYTAAMQSNWLYEAGQVRWRTPAESIFTCWKTEPSTNIYLGTSVQLAEDVIRDLPLAFGNGNSRKYSKKYSILVKQYGISREEFEYWQMLKRNTENVGSLFDAQPSQVTGNIARVDGGNPEESVFGYFSVRSMSTKRLFISVDELSAHGFKKEYQSCDYITVGFRQLAEYMNYNLILDEIPPSPGGGPAYIIAPVACADCRVLGGENRKPVYWE
ncbi:DUF4249 domain-containing protein [Pontibacter roseus]|uniref:DUF4249 domain-containing protein n=1 Tax=Pontibacter roseus TaxID=336989 RepID=UPI00037FEFA5|nr:DUF4249 domain-containing protein [Pontibacter roseus]